MGFRLLDLKLPTDYDEAELRRRIGKALRIREFRFHLENQSLDARNKARIHWTVRVLVQSDALSGPEAPERPTLHIPYKKRNEKVVVVGSGPAGFFAALACQEAGFHVTLLERGLDVEARAQAIAVFEAGGGFHAQGNYAFGEGGAGTFSDGKLTSRSKRISLEKAYVLDQYIAAGAPPEIAYLSHPHLGSDNLRILVRRLRKRFEALGGTVRFGSPLEDLRIEDGRVRTAILRDNELEADHFILATGHSAYETYRLLLRRGVRFIVKPFAIGSRVEHAQPLINRAQWGVESLPGVKAAEYRLTHHPTDGLPVYTFCMCPGGTIVQATAYDGQQVVNGMSLYARGGAWANAACVAGIRLEELLGRNVSPPEALDWVESLERRFYNQSGGYQAPCCTIRDFLDARSSLHPLRDSSYALGLLPAPLWEWLPAPVSRAMRSGLEVFASKLKGFDDGLILGLESKTSSPLQVVRGKDGRCQEFDNLFMVGEGSGHAGGIVSSAADGLKAAMTLASG